MKFKIKQIISLLILFTIGYTSVGLRVNPEDLTLIDSQGRVRIYHGVNVVYKPYPFYPEYDGNWNSDESFNEKDVQYLKEWGFNHIRLYMAWDGVEPSEGKYNMDYINNIKNIVSMCENAGIDVLLDFHQDLYSQYFCGEGLPSWLVQQVLPVSEQNFPDPLDVELKKDENGYPILEDCHQKPFYEYYQSYDVQKISQDLTLNTNKIADKMGEFWQFVALEFKDIPNILGYELINEPYGMSIYETPILDWIPGVQMNKYILPFYNLINDYIRAVDKTSLVFYEPVQGEIFNTGFNTNVGGPAYQQLEVYSYHVYCPWVNDEGEPTKPLLCKYYDKIDSSAAIRHYEKIGVAGWLTEFGALGNTEKDANELDNVLGNADQVFNSWSYWQYKYFNDITTAAANPNTEGFWDEDGQLQETKVAALSRAYAYKICGNPLNLSWNRKKEVFELEVKINRAQCSTEYNTEIYLSEYFHYKDGFNAEFTNCDSCKLESLGSQSYYQIVGDDQIQDGQSWSLKVTKK